jgi:hypothetical protein
MALAAATAVGTAAPASAQDVYIDKPSVAVACPYGVWRCVEDGVAWAGRTLGDATHDVCVIVFGPYCSIPTP